METEGEVNKFERISGIFSQFSEEYKDKLLEIAKNLLKVQRDDTASVSHNEISEGRCPEKL
jgi:hypothetical protein